MSVGKPRPGSAAKPKEFSQAGQDMLIVAITQGAHAGIAAVGWRNPLPPMAQMEVKMRTGERGGSARGRRRDDSVFAFRSP